MPFSFFFNANQPNYVKKNAALKVRGIPVLYLHGNKGHYKEVRSLGYTSDLVADSTKVKKRLEYFTVDFQEEASAFNGAHLQDQSEYVNTAVNAILRLYRKQASYPRRPYHLRLLRGVWSAVLQPAESRREPEHVHGVLQHRICHARQ